VVPWLYIAHGPAKDQAGIKARATIDLPVFEAPTAACEHGGPDESRASTAAQMKAEIGRDKNQARDGPR